MTTAGTGGTDADSRIEVLLSDGTPLETVGASGYSAGRFDFGLAVAGLDVGPGGELLVADAGNNRVQVFSNQGEFLFKFGGVGLLGGRIRVSSEIAIGKQGHIFVADFYNNRIQEFSKDGCFIAKWGVKGKDPGQFDGPTDLTVDSEGRVYVVDWGNDRIQVFKSGDPVKE